MLDALLLSLAVNFGAELGDKSQLVTMTYALRHRWWVVLSGVGLAAVLLRGLSVGIGHFLSLKLPARPITVAAAVAFLGFALWTWLKNTNTDGDDEVPEPGQPRSVLFSVFTAYVLAELGDKTMFATIALASGHHWLGVWIGSTVGMVAADGLAIAVGMLLHRQLSERFLHVAASLLFLECGLWMLFSSALGHPAMAVAVTATVLVAVAGTEVARGVVGRRSATRPATVDTCQASGWRPCSAGLETPPPA